MMLRVRPYRQKDAEQIVTWCRDETAFYKWSAGMMGSYPLTAQRMTEATAGRIDNDGYFPFAAFDEQGIVGFFTLRCPNGDRNELRFGFVIVSPEVRGKGYGKKMLRLGIKFAQEVYGARRISLGVFDNNPAAYHCYKAVGFIETGETEKYEIMGMEWNCIEMELACNP